MLESSSLFASIWNECGITVAGAPIFLKIHFKCLQGNFKLSYIQPNSLNNEETDPQPGPSRGRPRVPFDIASTKIKLRRIEELIANYTPEELCFAAERVNLPRCQNRTKMTPENALVLYYDLNLSVEKYNILRSKINSMHKDCFPSYRTLLATKSALLPSKIIVTKTSAEVDL